MPIKTNAEDRTLGLFSFRFFEQILSQTLIYQWTYCPS